MAAPLLITATALQVYGQLQQGKAAQQAAEFNAQTAERNATNALGISASNQEASGRRSRQIIGNQAAAAAQSGIGMGGSNKDLLEQSQTAAELEALNIAYGGASEATAYRNEAALQRWQGKVARRASYLNAATSIFGNAAAYGSFGGGGTQRPPSTQLGYGISSGRPSSNFGLRSNGLQLRSVYD